MHDKTRITRVVIKISLLRNKYNQSAVDADRLPNL